MEVRESVRTPAGERLPRSLEVRLEKALRENAAEEATGVQEGQSEVLTESVEEG